MPALWVPAILAGATVALVGSAWFRRRDPDVEWAHRICGVSGDETLLRRRWATAVIRLLTSDGAQRSRTARRRRHAIDRQALDFVELLVAATEAGLPPALAVERAAGMTSGALGEELNVAARQITLGLGWRTALEQVVARTGSPAMRRLTGSLSRAHRLGTSPRQSLRSIADELRLERRARAEELARRAPVKMLFPLVLLILPAFLLLTVGPVLLATVRSLQ